MISLHGGIDLIQKALLFQGGARRINYVRAAMAAIGEANRVVNIAA